MWTQMLVNWFDTSMHLYLNKHFLEHRYSSEQGEFSLPLGLSRGHFYRVTIRSTHQAEWGMCTYWLLIPVIQVILDYDKHKPRNTAQYVSVSWKYFLSILLRIFFFLALCIILIQVIFCRQNNLVLSAGEYKQIYWKHNSKYLKLWLSCKIRPLT